MSVDLSELVSSAFKTVGTSIGGVVRTVVYRTTGSQVYDPATGSVTTQTIDHSVSAIFTNFKREQKDTALGNGRSTAVEFGDQKCLITYADLPFTPSLSDTIIDGTSNWSIVDRQTDPTGKALHTFHLRMT